MSTIDPRATENRRNRKFISTNGKALKKYALNSQKKFGQGIIVINSTLVENGFLTEQDLVVRSFDEEDESTEGVENTLIRPISYLNSRSFWFKIIRIKIKKKYEIDIRCDYDLDKQFLLVFVKDSAVDSFSIYSMKIDINNC